MKLLVSFSFRFFHDTDPLERLWDDQKLISVVFDEPLKKLSAGGGAYVNEVRIVLLQVFLTSLHGFQADPFAPDWKNAFYGAHYDRLLSIKDKWDPEQLLYASIAVGGDRWEEIEDGRLCRIDS